MRYSFWDALGDVGGFHDGLVLLINFFIGPFTARGFFFDLVKKLREEPSQVLKSKNKRIRNNKV